MKKKVVKRLLVGVMAASITLGMAACGGVSDGDVTMESEQSGLMDGDMQQTESVPDSTVQTLPGDEATTESDAIIVPGGDGVSNVDEESSQDVAVINENTNMPLTGVWQLDTVKNDSEVLSALFGAGLEEGNSLELKDAGMFSYYIGTDVGGDGIYTATEESISADVTTYMEGVQEQVALDVVEEEGITYLVMDYNGETLYWSQPE